MAEELRALSTLYNFHHSLFSIGDRQGPRSLRFLSRVPVYSDQLLLNKMQLSSPGFQDLLGVGRVISELRKVIPMLRDWKVDKELKRQKLMEQRLKNLATYTTILRKAVSPPRK
jgi:hypothetical protein